jgi:hypothetical protein
MAYLFLAGGLGINLTAADTVVLYDSDYNPHADLQALSRAHRLGQEKRVLVLRLIVQGTVEDRIMQIARRKLAMDHLVIERMENTASLETSDIRDILRYGVEDILKTGEDVSQNTTPVQEEGKRMMMPPIDDADMDKLLEYAGICIC